MCVVVIWNHVALLLVRIDVITAIPIKSRLRSRAVASRSSVIAGLSAVAGGLRMVTSGCILNPTIAVWVVRY